MMFETLARQLAPHANLARTIREIQGKDATEQNLWPCYLDKGQVSRLACLIEDDVKRVLGSYFENVDKRDGLKPKEAWLVTHKSVPTVFASTEAMLDIIKTWFGENDVFNELSGWARGAEVGQIAGFAFSDADHICVFRMDPRSADAL